jgi:hypothetical protein
MKNEERNYRSFGVEATWHRGDASKANFAQRFQSVIAPVQFSLE